MVQTLKRGLKKMVEQQGAANWDQLVPWVAMGYRMSPQESTKLSPYEMLFGVAPVVPPAIKQRLSTPINLDHDTPAALAQLTAELQHRAALMQRHSTIAGHNLTIAQHRDSLRYAKLRSGGYKPKLMKFEVGDFVYVRMPSPRALDMPVKPDILQVKEARPAGVLILQGKCGGTIAVHMRNCAPCHRTDIDPALDLSLSTVPADLPCEICHSPEDGHVMLVCDSCETGWHTYCLSPPLASIPDGVWICPRCVTFGVTKESVPARPSGRPSRVRRPKAIEENAAGMHGRAVKQQVIIKQGSQRVLFERHGVVTYRGAQTRPKCFAVRWQDGSVSEPMSGTQLAKILLPASVGQHPAAVSAISPAITSGNWDLSTKPGLRAALQQMMPGDWTEHQVGRLHGKLQAMYQAAEQLPIIPTRAEEVQVLADAIDFSKAGLVVDVWSGTSHISQVLAHHGVRVITNDLNPNHQADHHEDALQPGVYRWIKQQYGMGTVVISPWFGLLDLALPLAVQFSDVAVCCHVPGHYWNSPIGPGREWFKQLVDQQRVHLVMNMPRSGMGMQCIWLVIAKDAEALQRIVRPGKSRSMSVSI